MPKQCPKCGASSADRKFIGQFCDECYLEMHQPDLPSSIIIYRCKDCGAYKHKQWNEDDIKASIARSLGSREYGIPKVRMSGDSFFATFEDIDHEFQVPVKITEMLCNSCLQKHSGYYEGIVQIRGKRAEDKRFVNMLIGRLEKVTFVQRVEELKEGIDIYYGDKGITRSVLSSMKLKVKISNKLWGVKDGRRVYRTTFLIMEDEKDE